MRCASCGGEEGRRLAATDPITGEAFEIAVCSSCGRGRTEPAPGPAELGRYYPTGYYGSGGIRFLVLPAVVLAAQAIAINLRMVRSSVLEQLSRDYVRTLRMQTAEAFVERVLAAVRRFAAGRPQADDITLVVIRRV